MKYEISVRTFDVEPAFHQLAFQGKAGTFGAMMAAIINDWNAAAYVPEIISLSTVLVGETVVVSILHRVPASA